jgi:hypothetical protein
MSQEYRGWVPKFSKKKKTLGFEPLIFEKKNISPTKQTISKLPKFPNQPHKNREKPTM